MDLTGIRRDVFIDRYALKDGEGKPTETSPDQMWARVARAIAEVEEPSRRAEWEARFLDALRDFRFVPGGRILAGAGTGQKVTFYNCLPPDQPVLTPDGYRPIAELDVRDAVITGHGRPRLVTQIYTREADEPLYRLTTSAGGVARLTGEHPVLARRGGALAWLKAAELSAGDLVASLPSADDTASGPWRVRRAEPVAAGIGTGGNVATLVRRTEERYAFLSWAQLVDVSAGPYRGTVYDLEVEEDHSFVTAGVIVSNCYVIPSPDDSRRGIMDNVALMVDIMSRGGGVGVNLSSLRPRGSYVRGVNGTASGPVSWGEVYSTATGSVIQGGSRRGALMLMLDDDHPDVEEFITVKKDLTRINNANLSVCVSDRFMQAVKDDAEWPLAWRGEVRKTLRARELWSLICESAWASGEPGVVFMERYQKRSNTWYCEDIRCVNPCFAGSTRIATSRGLVPAEELYRTREPLSVAVDRRALDEAAQVVGGARHVSTGVTLRPAAPVFKTGEDVPVFRLVTGHGYEVTATRDHRFLTPAGYVELQHLKPGDVVYLQSGEGAWSQDDRLPEVARTEAASGRLRAGSDRGRAEPPERWSRELGQLLGWLAAHGFSYDRGGEPRASLVFGGAELELLPYFRDLVEGWFGVRGTTVTRHSTTALHYEAVVARFARALGVGACRATERRVPDAVWRAPREAVVGFLQGLFAADGTVSHGKSCSVRLAGRSADLLKEVQLLLLNLGIVSRLRQRRPAGRALPPDGRRVLKSYATRAQWELTVDTANRDRFAREVGCLIPAQQAEMEAFIASEPRVSNAERFVAEIASVESAGIADVYDTTEPTAHSVVGGGIVMHQCGEQGLGPWGVCNLGAVNLSAFAKDGDVDWAALHETVGTAIRFLDNVIDTTEYYFEENERQQRYGIRRTGLGTMGLADLLIKLRIRYGSPEAVELCERIYRFIRDEAYRTSALIAREKGAFPAFDREQYLRGHFIQQLPEEVRELIAAHGTRNGVLLTQAPTGTTSLVAGASSGIEPVYAFSFKRTDRTGTHIVYHELFQRWLDEHAGEPVPPYFVAADELTPEEHVRMQAVIQQYVDSSISKTVNAPNDHTVDQVKTLYTLAYDLGCKGVTYFRDGCRTGVLSRLEDDKPKAAAPRAGGDGGDAEDELPLGRAVNGAWGHVRPIERPSRLEGFTERKQTPVGTLFLTLNTLDDHPVELFAQIGKAGSDVSAFTEGIARLVSLALRSGVDPTEVANQLVGIGGSRSVGFGPGRVRSVPDAIGQFVREIWDELRKRQAARAKGEEGAGGGKVLSGMAGSGGGPRLKAKKTSNGSGKGNGNGNGGGHGNGHGHGTAAPSGLATEAEEHAVAVDPLLEGNAVSFNLCPSCGLHTLAYMEGCALCFACGFSEC